MNDAIRTMINAMREQILYSYQLDGERGRKAEALFVEVEEAGEDARDMGDFMDRWDSEYNAKYVQLVEELEAEKKSK
ncbi:MAG: hypothetical protein ACOX4I_08700 [Anaerovoracaceae bacterium]|jgi:hypothetical protein